MTVIVAFLVLSLSGIGFLAWLETRISSLTRDYPGTGHSPVIGRACSFVMTTPTRREALSSRKFRPYANW